MGTKVVVDLRIVPGEVLTVLDQPNVFEAGFGLEHLTFRNAGQITITSMRGVTGFVVDPWNTPGLTTFINEATGVFRVNGLSWGSMAAAFYAGHGKVEVINHRVRRTRHAERLHARFEEVCDLLAAFVHHRPRARLAR